MSLSDAVFQQVSNASVGVLPRNASSQAYSRPRCGPGRTARAQSISLFFSA